MSKSTKPTIDLIPLFTDGFLIDLISEEESDRAQETLDKLYGIVGKESFDSIIDYLMSQVAHKLISDENSPLLKAVNDALEDMGQESSQFNETTSAQIRELKKINNKLSQQNVKLIAAVKSRDSSLALVRRRLKCPAVKEDLDLSQILNKQVSLTPVEQAVVNLANAIKDACICIKNRTIM